MKLMTIAQAAEMTQLSPATWRAWISRRKVGVVRLGRCVRIPEDEIIRLVREGTVPVKTLNICIGRSPRQRNRLEPNREVLSANETDMVHRTSSAEIGTAE
jgi:excisionase family DNA binding protein